MSGLRLGVDLGGTSILAVVLGPDRSVLSRAYGLTEDHAEVEPVLQRLEIVTRAALAKAGARPDAIEAAGMGVPGEVEGDRLRATPILPTWRDVPVGTLLARRLGIQRVDIENDANAALIGECALGAARGADQALLLTLGTGIGGALAVGGRLLRGFQGSAGEVGHLSVDPAGPPCWCGNRGCLGQLASATALTRAWREATGRDEDGRAIASALEAGDARAAAVVDELAGWLARGIAGAAVVVAPEVVVLTGGIVDGLAEPLLAGVRSRLAARPYPAVLASLRVESAALGPWAGAVGAALLEAP